MATGFTLKAILTAVDKMSPTIKTINKNIAVMERQLKSFGRGGVALGAGLAGALALAEKSFMKQEKALAGLENAFMKKGGNIPKVIESIKKQVIELGSALPGTNTEFAKLAETLKMGGLSDQVIAGGAFKAAAYLGAVTADMGVTYEQAGHAVTTFSNAIKIADQDLVPFSDSIQKALFAGGKLDDLTYAFSRVGGSLSALGYTGKGVADELLPLMLMMNRTGMAGEQIGTGLQKLIMVFAMHGKFRGIKDMVQQLQKLQKTTESKKLLEFFKNAFGEEHAGKALAIATGQYQDMARSMEDQAGMMERLANIAKTLEFKLENATGNTENLAASMGKIFKPEGDSILDKWADLSSQFGKFIEDNPKIIRSATSIAAAITIVKLGALGAAKALGILRIAFISSPAGLIATVLAGAAGYIIANWEEVGPFFNELWERIGKGWKQVSQDFTDAIDGMPKLWQDTKDAIFAVWDAMANKWDSITGGFRSGWDWVKGIIGGPFVSSSSGTAPAGAATAPKLSGDLNAIVGQAAAAHGVDANLIRSVIAAESGGNAKALSNKGAAGLMQLMPATARRFGVNNRFDPGQNISGGAAYLGFLLKRYGGDEAKAIAAYNAGEGNVDKYGGIPPFAETQNYTRKVLGHLRALRVQGGIDVNFNNAPPGTRVEPLSSSGVKITPKVGYRSLGRPEPAYG